MYNSSTSTHSSQITNSSNGSVFDFTIPAGMLIFFSFIAIVALVVVVAYVIRLWMVQTATFEMQKDVREIRNWLAEQSQRDVTPHELADKAAGTYESSSLVASEPELAAESTERKIVVFSKPSRLFIWVMSVAGVLAVIGLIVLIKLGL